jgi:hypothetical protein
VCDFGAWRGGEEFVHCAAFVGFHVSEGDPAESLERNDAGNRLRHEGEHASRARVKKERIVSNDEELIERESARRCVRDARRQAKDAIRYLVSISLHEALFLFLRQRAAGQSFRRWVLR